MINTKQQVFSNLCVQPDLTKLHKNLVYKCIDDSKTANTVVLLFIF